MHEDNGIGVVATLLPVARVQRSQNVRRQVVAVLVFTGVQSHQQDVLSAARGVRSSGERIRTAETVGDPAQFVPRRTADRERHDRQHGPSEPGEAQGRGHRLSPWPGRRPRRCHGPGLGPGLGSGLGSGQHRHGAGFGRPGMWWARVIRTGVLRVRHDPRVAAFACPPGHLTGSETRTGRRTARTSDTAPAGPCGRGSPALRPRPFRERTHSSPPSSTRISPRRDHLQSA